ncbi:site-specific integrase [Rhizobium leguminosarum]|uniref:site-specific integrase n=1 Tax=Rhizobium leguminosarum TaxID=384 RepID=UPI003ED0208E
MYLTRRPSGFRFQVAVPTTLHRQLGRTPVRINLGRISAKAALGVARLLSGHIETLFLRATLNPLGCTVVMNRETLKHSLEALAAEIQDLNSLRKENFKSYAAIQLSRHGMDGFEDVLQKLEEEGDQRTQDHFLDMAHEAERMQTRLQRIADALKLDQVALEAIESVGGVAASGPLVALIGALQSQVEVLSGKVDTSLDGGPTRPLLSEVLDPWIEQRRGLQIDKSKLKTDYNRINDFIKFAGDKPVNKYVFSDFQAWSNLLVRVPQNQMKVPTIRNMSHQDAADYNDSLPSRKRLPTLSEKTIDSNYLSPLRIIFREEAANHQFRSPLADADVRISGAAKSSVERLPFDVSELNKWFAHSAKEARADSKWLPLLATITGARIGELVYLQGKDVCSMLAEDESEHWVIDLRNDIELVDGESEQRKTKNKGARRLIALHEVFAQVGFIEYARTRKSGEWLFPAAFRYGKEEVKDPADAASKRMGRMLREVGIHKVLEKVFHSSRHTAKDLMRMARIDERTHDLQTGHTHKNASRNYGTKVLKRDEVEVLASLPLPAGLDLSPYIEHRRPARRGYPCRAAPARRSRTSARRGCRSAGHICSAI